MDQSTDTKHSRKITGWIAFGSLMVTLGIFTLLRFGPELQAPTKGLILFILLSSSLLFIASGLAYLSWLGRDHSKTIHHTRFLDDE